MPSKSKKQARTMTAACKNDKFRKKVGISKDVACDFHDEDRGKWHESLENEEMTKKVDEKFELSSEKMKDDETDVRSLMKMAGINKKLEDNKEGQIDFDGVLTGVADGEIKVDEDLEKLRSLAGLSEKNVKRSIFSRDQEHDRFSLFKEYGRREDIDKTAAWLDKQTELSREKAKKEKNKKDESSIDEAPSKPLHQIDPPTGPEKNVYKGPWGQGGSNDPRVREPESAGREPDSAEIMDKFHEINDPDSDGSVAAMKVIDWVKNEFDVAEDYAVGLVHQAFEDAGLDLSASLQGHVAANEEVPTPVGMNADGEDVSTMSDPNSGIQPDSNGNESKLVGPFPDQDSAMADAQAKIGGHDGYNFKVTHRPDGWYWDEYIMDSVEQERMWEEFEAQHKRSEMFAEGSYDRMIVELIVEEMKKGKDIGDISETLGFDPDEVFYVVEFFKNKKVQEGAEEKETVSESQESTDNDLERIKYLTEYKN